MLSKKLQEENQKLWDKISALEDEIKDLKFQISASDLIIAEYENKIQELKAENRKLLSKNSNSAFQNSSFADRKISLSEEKEGDYYIYYRATELIGYESYSGSEGYYRQNSHGSVVSVTDSLGDEKRNYTYSDYGKKEAFRLKPMGEKTTVYVWKAETDGVYNPFGYCGEYLDEETGFIYLRNRYYDPSIGRFISEDPILSGNNWYNYCDNNPINYTDSTGLDKDLDDYVKSNYAGKITVTIVAERPVANSRIAVDLETGDVGHTFIRLDYGDGTVIYKGFYPYSPLSTEQILQKEDVNGIIRDDSTHDWNAAVTFEITKGQADKINNFMNGFDKQYNMVTMNCTTFGVKALQAAGLKSPTSEHKWAVPNNAHQMIVDNLPSDKWFKSATATLLLNGLKGYSPADAVQDFKERSKYVLKYGGSTHTGTNTGKTN